jgi:putative hydrolase of the HAD superfamily
MTTVLFDFFGTLVTYSPSRVTQGYPRSWELVRRFGAALTYDEFLAAIDQTFKSFDRQSSVDDREFSMASAAAAFLSAQLKRPPDVAEITAFEDAYIGEWSAAVAFLDDLEPWLTDLRTRHRLAVVSNTHSPTMVPRFLSSSGLAALFDAVVLSVDVGWRKPHPLLYEAALSRLDIAARDAVFVGDSYDADFAGPSSAGIRSFLIDPHHRFDVPADRRLDSVFHLADRLP